MKSYKLGISGEKCIGWNHTKIKRETRPMRIKFMTQRAGNDILKRDWRLNHVQQ